MTPRDPDFEARIRESFERQGAMAAFGASIVSIEPGRCTLSMPFGAAASQQHGLFHGGVIATLADSAGGYAAMSLTEPGVEVVTVEYKINFVGRAKGDAIRAEGRVLRSGRTLTVSQVAVFVEGEAEPCAVAQQTVYAFTPPA